MVEAMYKLWQVVNDVSSLAQFLVHVRFVLGQGLERIIRLEVIRNLLKKQQNSLVDKRRWNLKLDTQNPHQVIHLRHVRVVFIRTGFRIDFNNEILLS